MNKILIIIFFLLPMQVYAFNWSKCKRVIDEYSWGLYPGGLFSSSTSFFTSTGDCAMIGMASHDKKVFLVHNIDNLKTDSARGGGEYLSAYASLSECNQKAASQLPTSFQKNFLKIYGEDVSNEPKAVYEAMEAVIQSDPILASGCKVKS